MNPVLLVWGVAFFSVGIMALSFWGLLELTGILNKKYGFFKSLDDLEKIIFGCAIVSVVFGGVLAGALLVAIPSEDYSRPVKIEVIDKNMRQ